MAVLPQVPPARILVVDDDQGIRDSLTEILEDDHVVKSVDGGNRAVEVLRKETFDLVLLDLIMPDMDGLEVLRRIKSREPSPEVIMVSATDKAKEAVTAIRMGANDYVTKPFDAQSILNLVERTLAKKSADHTSQGSASRTFLPSSSPSIIYRSMEMKKVLDLVDKVAKTTSSVLITGESGTGKELVARAIHHGSPRAAKPFVAINCASIPSELIESELFGHEKGSFTGADRRTVGKFEYAHEGTIFLDEISSLKMELQAQLLRVLQEKEVTRVGSNQSLRIDVRVIAATNTRLETLVQEGRFREDLYFRLNVIPITLPPLRNRKGDITLLANHFLKKFNRILNKTIPGLNQDAMAVLENYPWPGNIRELENFIERMVVLGVDGKTLEENDLPFDLLFHEHSAFLVGSSPSSDPGLTSARQNFERQYILRALRCCRWNHAEASKKLKIHRNTLWNKIKTLSIQVDEDD